MDNETTIAIESLKAQANGWKECCRKWQDKNELKKKHMKGGAE